MNAEVVANLALLREAAAKMRERAEAASVGPWRYDDWAYGSEVGCGVAAPNHPQSDDTSTVILASFGEDGVSDAEHIASWHPAVALAVADWLDIGANPYACVDREPMCAVARAYLRSAR